MIRSLHQYLSHIRIVRAIIHLLRREQSELVTQKPDGDGVPPPPPPASRSQPLRQNARPKHPIPGQEQDDTMSPVDAGLSKTK